MPSRPKPRSPRTPAPGSSPVTPPGGSAPRPRAQGRPQAALNPRPPTNPLSPLAQQMVRRRLAQTPARPVVRPPGLPVPTPARPAPQMQSRPAPTPIAPTPPKPVLPQNTFLQATASPWGAGLMEQGGLDLTHPALAPIVKRLGQAGEIITAPNFSELAPPTQSGLDPNAVIGGASHSQWENTPGVVGVEPNEDGTEDWVLQRPDGSTYTAPHTQITPPGPLRMAGRSILQGVSMFLEGAGLVAKAPERVIGLGVQAVNGGAEVTGRVRLPDGTFYIPPTGADPARAAQVQAWDGTRRFGNGNPTVAAPPPTPQTVDGRPITHPSAASRLTEGSVDILKRLYPEDTPARAQAFYDLTRIAYSPGTSQVRAGIRMLEYGQAADEALYGDGAYVTEHLVTLGYLTDKLGAIKADPLANYVYESWKADGYSDADIIERFDTEGLPGEQFLPSELTGQILIDPLNLITGPNRAAVQAERAAAARLTFSARTERTAGEIIASLSKAATPTGIKFLDNVANFFLAKTPTSVKNQALNIAQDTLSYALTAVDDVLRAAAPVVDEAARASQPQAAAQVARQATERWKLLKAMLDFAEEAPVRVAGMSDEAWALRPAGWNYNQALAEKLMAKYAVTLSDGGKLGGALLRQILTDQSGQINFSQLKKLIDAGGTPYDIMAALMKKSDEAMTLLLTPARAGATNALEFVANTGKPAQAFPTFERFIAGASEKVNTARLVRTAAGDVTDPAELALLRYDPGLPAELLAGYDSIRNWANSKLWTIFTFFNPAYSSRNFVGDYTTAIADGTLSLKNEAEIDALIAEAGNPLAATRGIGSGEVVKPGGRLGNLAGGFAGTARSTDIRVVGPVAKRLGIDIPLGAQAVESAASKRVWAAAYEQYWNNVLVPGKGLADFPPRLVEAVGEDTARRVGQHLLATRGDVAGARRIIETAAGAGVVDTWRVAADAHVSALRAFGGEAFTNKALAVLEGSASETEFVTGMNALLREAAEKLKVSESAIPGLQAMTGPVAEEFAADLDLARELGVNVNHIPGGRVDDFEAVLKVEQNQQAAARGAALDALQHNPTDAGFEAFRAADQKITAAGADVAEQLRKLRRELKEYTAKYNNIKKIPPKLRAAYVDAKWAEYFAARDKLWNVFRARANATWNQVSEVSGLVMRDMPLGAAAPVEEAAAQAVARTGNAKVDFANELGWLKTQRDQFAADSADFRRWQIRINELDADAKAYFKQYGYQDVPYTPTRTLAGVSGAPTTPAIDAATMPPEVSAVTPITGGPPVEVTNAPGTIPSFVATNAGPPATPGGTGDLGDVNALVGTPMQIPSKWTPADPRSILSTLESMKAQALSNWGQTRPVNMSDEMLSLYDDWLDTVTRQVQEHRLIGGQVAAAARDFTLLNYGDKRNLDMALGVIFPYQYWYGRTYKNWMKRAVQNPAIMANYGRYRQTLATLHAALPEYYRQQLSTDDLSLDMESPMMFNLEQTMSPLYGVLGSDFSDPLRRRAKAFGINGFGGIVEDIGSFGPTPWAPIAMATGLSAYMSGDAESGSAWINNYLGTLPRAIRAATALAGETAFGQGIGLPPGGINPDIQMFLTNMANGNSMGVTGMTQWERNRVATTLAGYYDNPPENIDPQDWIAQVEEASYLQRGELWDKAMQEMFVGTAPMVMSSYFLGLSFKGRSETEAEVGLIYSEVAKLRANYASMTPEEIQQAYLDLQARHPMYETLMFSKAQGAKRDDVWVWEALGRVGLGDREAWEAAGVSEAALDAFFKTKTTDGMAPTLLTELLAGAATINARNRPVSLEEQQRQLDAKIAYDKLNTRLDATFADTGAFELEDEFYRIRDEQGRDAANAWMENLPPGERGQLSGLLDARTEAMMAAGPDVQRYFVDPQRYEAMLMGQYYDQAETAQPGIIELSGEYWKLRDARAFGPADMLLDEHPELTDYWAATRAKKAGLHAEVMTWLNKLDRLAPTTQGEERADFDPLGYSQSKLDEHYQEINDQRAGIYESRYTQPGGGGDNAAPTSTATAPGTAQPVSASDEYIAKYEAKQAAKLAAQEGRETYLTAERRLAYGDSDIAPLVEKYGFDGAAAYLEQPIAAEWPTAPGGVSGLVAMMGDAESVREALLVYATDTQTADWAKFVGLLRNMTDEQLAALSKQYPQMADAGLVAEQARTYAQPTIQSLHDILGFGVTFREDGSFSISKQTAKKDKKTGSYGPYTQGGDTPTGGGGGFSGGSTSRSTYARMGGRGGGGGGATDTAPDPVAEQVGTWISFAAQLKLEQPDVLGWLMDFFDMPDDYARQAILQRYPGLYQFLQTLGAEKVASLAEAYYSWREDQMSQQQPPTSGRKTSTGPRIQRYYRQRPSTTGLQ